MGRISALSPVGGSCEYVAGGRTNVLLDASLARWPFLAVFVHVYVWRSAYQGNPRLPPLPGGHLQIASTSCIHALQLKRIASHLRTHVHRVIVFISCYQLFLRPFLHLLTVQHMVIHSKIPDAQSLRKVHSEHVHQVNHRNPSFKAITTHTARSLRSRPVHYRYTYSSQVRAR